MKKVIVLLLILATQASAIDISFTVAAENALLYLTSLEGNAGKTLVLRYKGDDVTAEFVAPAKDPNETNIQYGGRVSYLLNLANHQLYVRQARYEAQKAKRDAILLSDPNDPNDPNSL